MSPGYTFQLDQLVLIGPSWAVRSFRRMTSKLFQLDQLVLIGPSLAYAEDNFSGFSFSWTSWSSLVHLAVQCGNSGDGSRVRVSVGPAGPHWSIV